MDHVAVDVQEEGAVLLLVDDVILDDLVVHGLARGDNARGGGARAGHRARRAEGLARDRLLAGEGRGASDDPGSGHGGGGHHDRASPSGEGVRREVRGVVTARVCVVMCTPGARRAATYLDWRGRKYRAAKSVGRHQPSSVARDLSGDPWSATPDFDPIGKSGDRVGPNAPPVSERHLRRVVGAAVPPCAHTDARVFPRPGSTASRDEMSGVDHGCVSSSRAPLAPACSAPPHDSSLAPCRTVRPWSRI